MTKRLTLLGFAAVAALWGPYVYAELARRPLAVPDEATLSPVVVPVAYAPATREEPVAAEMTSLAAAIDPELAAAPAVAEPAMPEHPELAPAVPDPEVVEHAVEHAAPTQVAPALAGDNAQPVAQAATAPEQPAPAPSPPAAEGEQEVEGPSVAAKADTAAAPADDGSETAVSATGLTAHAKAVHDGHLSVIPDALVPAVHSAFANETRDLHWASREEPRLTKLLSGAGVPTSAIAEVRCQSTVCRVSIHAADIEAAAQSQLYQRVQQEFGPGLALDPTSQEQHAAFYVMRKAQ